MPLLPTLFASLQNQSYIDTFVPAEAVRSPGMRANKFFYERKTILPQRGKRKTHSCGISDLRRRMDARTVCGFW